MIVAELYRVKHSLGEVFVLTFECVHYEAIVGEEMHPPPLIYDMRFRYLHQF